MEFFTYLTPFISLTSSLKLTWLQFSHYLTCTRRTQCPSYCAWQCVPVLWREHQIEHILQMSLSSLVTWCSWWLHGSLRTFFCCASCLLLRDQACVFRTSDHPSSECGRICSHTICSTISLDDCVHLLKSLVNNYW